MDTTLKNRTRKDTQIRFCKVPVQLYGSKTGTLTSNYIGMLQATEMKFWKSEEARTRLIVLETIISGRNWVFLLCKNGQRKEIGKEDNGCNMRVKW